MFVYYTRQDSMQISEGMSSLSHEHDKNKPIADAGWVLPDKCRLVCQSRAHILLKGPNRHQLSACFCFVRGFEGEDSLENLYTVLFRMIEKRSV